MADLKEGPVRKLVEAWRVEHDKTTAILEELETLLSGGAAIGELLKRAERKFSEVYEARYRTRYLWQYVKDRPQMKRLLKTLGVEEVEYRMVRYIRSNDEFFTSRRHPFGLFVATIVQHARESAPERDELELTGEPIADCRHQPPCKTDSEHTRRRSADMRGAF